MSKAIRILSQKYDDPDSVTEYQGPAMRCDRDTAQGDTMDETWILNAWCVGLTIDLLWKKKMGSGVRICRSIERRFRQE